MQIFSDFHQGPPRTIWQGPRRQLHKWPLLKSAPATWVACVVRPYAMCHIGYYVFGRSRDGENSATVFRCQVQEMTSHERA